ncbi:putative Astacin-like metalloendopeptidase [Hypsibius exemplaris]|uniref:Metalloendopeptidase n=1 Tax=Hypsibius exemplaris TaxID=2072580 RepID=A0A9X6NJS2_HYPEX|nr:putative Astacin-like metalloendopeptidase [Hypsibius exemplaris]
MFTPIVSVPTSAPLLEPPDDAADPPTGTLFERDIMGVDSESVEQGSLSGGKNGVSNEAARWPNAEVPYVFSKLYERDAARKHIVLTAMRGFDRTCVRFIPRKNERDYIVINAGNRLCASFVGNQHQGKQDVFLSIGACTDELGKIQHELMHAIGFYHEQSRIDRDDYVEINWDNVQSRGDFQRYDNTTAFGLPYDFGSILHYGTNDLGINESVWTIRPLLQYRANYSSAIGQRLWLSDSDEEKINRMYKCGKHRPPVPEGFATTDVSDHIMESTTSSYRTARRKSSTPSDRTTTRPGIMARMGKFFKSLFG